MRWSAPGGAVADEGASGVGVLAAALIAVALWTFGRLTARAGSARRLLDQLPAR